MESLTVALLGLAWGFPLALCLLWYAPWGRRLGERVVPWSALPALTLALVGGGGSSGDTVVTLPLLTDGVEFVLDPLGRAFLFVTGLLWLAGGVYAAAYHRDDPRSPSFFLFFALTLAGNVGLVLAGDLLGFYLFFALMTFAAYGLVVHARDRRALRAGRVYVAMAVLGELALIAGLWSLGSAFGGVPTLGVEIEESWRLLDAGGASGVPLLATGVLLSVGFGVKAGIVPLHLWLPLAHPVAPTAASALLSGAMIKAGLLGWLRVLPAETTIPGLAEGFLALGAFSAFYGVVMGIPQDDPKTVLAYSSVSQIGYMAIGVGLLVSGSVSAPLAITAIAVYAVHHGLAKGALFLSVGLADRAPSDARPGGDRWRVVILAGASIPALAIAGLPLSSGAVAKNVLKDGLGELGGVAYAVLDPLLIVASFGTTLLLFRFLVTLTRRRADAVAAARADAEDDHSAPGLVLSGLVAPWAVLVAVGLLGVTWLPAFVPAAGPTLPGPLEGWVTGLAPVALAVLVGWAVLRRPGLLGRLGRVRIPAGDLLVGIEWLLRRFPSVDQEALIARLAGRVRRVFRPIGRLGRVAARVVDRDAGSIRGTPMAVSILGLALALFALLVR